MTAALANTKAARDEASDATRVAQRLEAGRAAIATGRTAVAGAAAAVKGFKWAAAAASGDAHARTSQQSTSRTWRRER